MIEAERIARVLTYGGEDEAAALLVATLFHDDADVDDNDAHLMRELEAAGCVRDGKPTTLGIEVAGVLVAGGAASIRANSH